jgi:hypothetical protein
MQHSTAQHNSTAHVTHTSQQTHMQHSTAHTQTHASHSTAHTQHSTAPQHSKWHERVRSCTVADSEWSGERSGERKRWPRTLSALPMEDGPLGLVCGGVFGFWGAGSLPSAGLAVVEVDAAAFAMASKMRLRCPMLHLSSVRSSLVSLVMSLTDTTPFDANSPAHNFASSELKYLFSHSVAAASISAAGERKGTAHSRGRARKAGGRKRSDWQTSGAVEAKASHAMGFGGIY